MAEELCVSDGNVEHFPGAGRSTVVTDELTRLTTLLQERCPRDAIVGFEFNGSLRVHIDIRSREDVEVVEALLPTLGTGLFHTLSRGSAAGNHRFFHRVSAKVAR